ncbi:MAG: hypothetical protein GY699_10725 [Desulfobacteraceae bacterium]|nr:hypothetical protein [Desulfobacteraceae bacterium]
MVKIKLILFIFLLLHIFCTSINADTYKDNNYNFQLTSPNSWKTKAYSDGPDRLFDSTTPDGNILVRVRAIHLSDPIPMDILRKVYEREYLKNSSLFREKTTIINGIKGQSFFYNWKYNGHDINVVSWFAMMPKMAYIVSRIIPKVILNDRVAEADRVIHSFQSSLSNSTPVKKKVASKPSILPAKPVTIISLIPKKSNFKPGQKITVKFSGLPANGQDWLALSDINHKPDEYFDMVMLQGKPQSGKHSFKGLPEGKYEIRVYTNWPDSGYTIAAKTGITVAKTPAAPKSPIAPPVLPEKKIPAPSAPQPVIAQPKPAAPKAKNLPPVVSQLTPAAPKAANPTPILSKAAPVRPTDRPLLAKVAIGKGYDGIAFIDQKGQTIVGPGLRLRYPEKFVNGYIIAYKDGKDRLFHRSGTVVPSKHKAHSTFSDGLASIGFNFITETGSIAFKKSFRNVKGFSEGLAPVKASKPEGTVPRWGYIDTSGAFVIEPQFEDAWQFSNNIAFVENKDGRRAMINRAGTLLTGFDFAGFSKPVNKLIKVQLYPHGKGETLLSVEGTDILGKLYKSITPRYDKKTTLAGWHITDSAGNVGLLDSSGKKIIIQPGQVKSVQGIGDGLIKVQKVEKGLFGYMDMKGGWVIEPTYQKADLFSEGMAFVQPERSGPVQMIDKTGKVIKKYPSSNMLFMFGSFMEGLAVVVDQKNGRRLGYVDSTGNWAIKPIFNGKVVNDRPEKAGFRSGLAPACIMQDGPLQCGFIDSSGLWVVDPKYITLPNHFQ